jgi:hypothetical protein
MGIERAWSVPAADSTANVSMRDVIGNKTDTHDGDSLYAGVKQLKEHAHKAQKVYPTLAGGVTLTTHATTWTLGTVTEIVPASTITSDFDIHEVIIEDANTQDKTYELVLYSGAGDTEVGRARFAVGSTKGGIPNATMQTPLIDANSRIRAALAIEDGSGKTATISLRYHTY